MYVEIPRECIVASFDLHYFGQLIQEFLSSSLVEPIFSKADHNSLKHMVERLDLDSQKKLLPRYERFGQLVFDLEKMQGLYLNLAGVQELSTYTGTRTVRIPVSGSIPFTDRVKKVIHHPMFFRLNNVQQLGLTYYVFPGACHTRLEHSLGVYSNVSRYISSLLADDYQPYFRQLINEEMIVTALLAGLLHDIGQHSFSHSLEDAGITPNHEAMAEMFITGKGMDNFVKADKYKVPLREVIENQWKEVNMDRLCWLISEKRKVGQTTGIGWEIIRAILSGPIDADFIHCSYPIKYR